MTRRILITLALTLSCLTMGAQALNEAQMAQVNNAVTATVPPKMGIGTPQAQSAVLDGDTLRVDLTENYGVPHGFASAVFMPHMLKYANGYDPSYAKAFYDEIGMSQQAYMRLVRDCLPTFDFRMDSEEIERALPRWDGNGSVQNTRARVTLSSIREVLTSMFGQ